MNTHISLGLDKRKPRKDGSFSIVMIISHFRKTTTLSLGHSIHEKDWNDKKQQAKKSFKKVESVTRFNNLLQSKKAHAMDVISTLDKDDKLRYISLQEIKDRIKGINSGQKFIAFGKKLVEDMKAANQFGNARNYSMILNMLRNRIRGNDLSFEELNLDFLNKWEIEHLGKGNSLNSLSVYFRTIRAIYNKGIKAGLVDQKAYPFKHYKIKSSPTEKRAISVENLQKIVYLQLESDHELFHVRNYFVASYMLFGMNFIDMAFLRVSDLSNVSDQSNGRIKYRRRKTSKLYDIKVNDQLKQILDFYLTDKQSDDFIFPIIKRDTLSDQYKDIEWARSRFNKGLKLLAKECKIQDKLTSYVARHSFATQAMFAEIPLQAISAMLGHTRLSTTQVYLASLPSEVLDEYHDRLKL